MARPVFIICSTSRSIDQATNQLSIFNVIEGLNINLPMGDQSTARVTHDDLVKMTPPAITIISTWMQEESDDPDTEYEFQIVSRTDDEEKVMSSGQFKFTRFTQRFLGAFVLARDNVKEGMLWIENRIRPVVGDSEWITQSYPIRITINQQASPEGDAESE